jgi:antitoxin MazE
VSVVDGGLVIQPAERSVYSLNDLLREVTPENVHRETDTGPAVGGEAW